MRVCILYRPQSEYSRKVEEYVRDFVHVQPSRIVKLIDIDSKEGQAMAELYDVMSFPATLALDDEGQLLKSWEVDLPLMDELSYYAMD